MKEDVSTLQQELAALTKEQAESSKIRKENHATFTKAKSELSEGLNGVRKALGVLRDYYGADADKMAMLQDDDDDMAFMQQPAAPKKHKKATGAGGGIIDILEVTEADFAKDLANEETEEADEAASYEKTTQENKVTKAQKEEDVKGKTRLAASLDKSISEITGDKTSTGTELSAVLEYLGKLNERCVAKPSKYEDRKAKRDAEIAGLKEALETLENETAFIQRRHRRRGARFMEPN